MRLPRLLQEVGERPKCQDAKTPTTLSGIFYLWLKAS